MHEQMRSDAQQLEPFFSKTWPTKYIEQQVQQGYKLTQAALNWVAAGAYTPLAQGLFAFQLGGAAFTHTIVENKMAGNIPVLVFFSSSIIVHSLHFLNAPANCLFIIDTKACLSFLCSSTPRAASYCHFSNASDTFLITM